MYVFNNIFNLYNIFFLKILINNSLIYFLIKNSFNKLLNLFNYIIILKKFFFNLKFIETFYFFYSFLFFLKKKDLNNKFLDDPFMYRNKFLKIYENFNNYINWVITTNFFINKKKFIFFYLIYILNNYLKAFLCMNKYININIIIYFIKNIYNNIIIFRLLNIKQYIIITYCLIYYCFLNIIYCVINLSIYILFYTFKIIRIFVKKNSYFIKILIFIIFFFYFSWFINYFFLLLYKHYILYIPLFNVKENFHFLNFEWIDLRNYFNIINLHNVLIDLNIHNNFFYNEIIKQLNLKLNNYNFKVSQNFNINLFIDENINYKIKDDDTILLNNIFEKWNKYHGATFIRRWRKYKRMLNWSLRHTFKGKEWYRALKKEKLKGSDMFFFNNNRYFENSKADIANNMGFWEDLNQVKQLPYNKEKKIQFQKTQALYTYFKKRHTSKKRPRYLLSYYIKLKNIPFNYIYKEFNIYFLENYKLKKIKQISFNFEKYLNKYKNVKKSVYLFKCAYINIKIFKFNKFDNKQFFFKKFFRNFIDTHELYIWKNKIPSLLVTEMRLHRLPPISTIDRYYKDHVMMGNTDEMHQLIYYSDLAKKSCLKNVSFKMNYIYKKYPYNMNNKNKYYQYVVKNYFSSLDTGIKISKKFFFLERSKLRNFNKLYNRLLNKIDTVYGNQLLKYKYWEKVFYLKRLNKKHLDFWGFFDYLKANKYTLAKDDDTYFTVFFLNRWKKDYYNMRIYLLRIISFLHYYTIYKKVKMNNNFTFFNLIKNVKLEGAPISLESLSTLNSLKYLNSNLEKKKGNIMDQTQEQEQINEALFYHFKLRWHFRELLNPNGVDSFGNKDKFMYIINLFFKKFNKYFIEYNKINKYNNEYKFKVKSYKIKVLRKIKNLKNFFFFNTKRNKGTRIFSLLNTFSISYHLKHLLWHSPYSYYFFKNNNILINFKNVKNFFYIYNFEKKIYNIEDYSYIFNLLLNTFEIKEDWAFFLTDNVEYVINNNILELTFYYVYNYGNFFFYYLNELDIFRIFNSLLKDYYNNFLIKLVRYRFILEKNDYSTINFIIHYLKQRYQSSYLKMRYFIYQTHETYVRYLKRKIFFFLRKRYWVRNRVDLIPFWFIFDYYIKCLIKYLFNKYFIKENFIFWWLNFRLKFSFFFFFWLIIQKYKYFFLENFKKKYLYFWIIILQYLNIMWDIISILYNDILYLTWYLNIIKNNYFLLLGLEYNIKIIQSLYKLIFFNYYLNIKVMIMAIFNYIIDLKILLLFKYNIQEKLQLLIKYTQNVKNKMIYLKSNYYYFKKQKLLRKRKRHVPLYSFLSTNLKRNWFSLKSRTSNFYTFHNIYLLNIKNMFFLSNNQNLNNSIFILINSIPIINKKLLKFELSFYWLYCVYILFFFLIYFINRKYFKIYFINKIYDSHNIDFKLINKKNENVFNLMLNLNQKQIYIYKYLLLKKVKSLNSFNLTYMQKFVWFKKFFNVKNFLNHTNFDQFDKNKPIYKSNLFIVTFMDINKLNNYIKNYMKMLYIKKNYLMKLSNDFLVFYEFNVIKKNLKFKYKGLTDLIFFNIIFFYWIFLIPYFFFQYILIKYHLKFYFKTKRRFVYIIRTFLDNIRLFVKINKYIGRSFFKSIYKSKRWKDPSHVFFNKKRSKRNHYSTNFLRFRKLYYRLSPLGPYYYWFAKINIVQYLFSFKNYFFNTIIKSYHYLYISLLYWIIILYYVIKYNKLIKKNKFQFVFFNKLIKF
jgi:hypothetical protein